MTPPKGDQIPLVLEKGQKKGGGNGNKGCPYQQIREKDRGLYVVGNARQGGHTVPVRKDGAKNENISHEAQVGPGGLCPPWIDKKTEISFLKAPKFWVRLG